MYTFRSAAVSYTCPCGAVNTLVVKPGKPVACRCTGCQAEHSWTWEQTTPPKREGRTVRGSEYVPG